MRDLGLENAKPSKFPGSKEQHKRSGGGPSDVDLHANLDKCANKGKGRGSVRESPGLGKNGDGARLAPVRSEDAAASEPVADRGGASVFAAPAEVGDLLAAGVVGCTGPVHREVGLHMADIRVEDDV